MSISTKERHAPAAWDDLKAQVRRMTKMLHKFKAREQLVAARLFCVNAAIQETNWKRAEELIQEASQDELKDALEYATDRDLALRVLIKSLTECANTPESRSALDCAKRLAPEAFEAKKVLESKTEN